MESDPSGDSCEPLCGFLGIEIKISDEQPVFLTALLSLQLYTDYFLIDSRPIRWGEGMGTIYNGRLGQLTSITY